jgi:hypothetical protein
MHACTHTEPVYIHTGGRSGGEAGAEVAESTTYIHTHILSLYTEPVYIYMAAGAEVKRARKALNLRLGPAWQAVWTRLIAKGLVHEEGGVLQAYAQCNYA